jgi:hypothetical protein
MTYGLDDHGRVIRTHRAEAPAVSLSALAHLVSLGVSFTLEQPVIDLLR